MLCRLFSGALLWATLATPVAGEIVFDWSRTFFSREEQLSLEAYVIKAARCYMRQEYVPYGTCDFVASKNTYTVIFMPLDLPGRAKHDGIALHPILAKHHFIENGRGLIPRTLVRPFSIPKTCPTKVRARKNPAL